LKSKLQDRERENYKAYNKEQWEEVDAFEDEVGDVDVAAEIAVKGKK